MKSTKNLIYTKMNTDELKNTLSGVKSISISVDDFIWFTNLKQDTYKKVSFDEAIQAEPFFESEYDMRILAGRAHLLTALGFSEKRNGWQRGKAFIENDIVLRSSDNDFMDKVEELNPTIDFRLK